MEKLITLDKHLVMARHTSFMHIHTKDRETPNKLAIVLYSAVDARKYKVSASHCCIDIEEPVMVLGWYISSPIESSRNLNVPFVIPKFDYLTRRKRFVPPSLSM